MPRVEPELTFVLKAPLKGPGVGLVDVLRATEYVVPSIEIIDARVTEPRRSSTRSPTTAPPPASSSAAGRCGPNDVDLRWVGAIFHRNADIEETGLAAGVLGHPAMAIAWLANKLAPFGTVLEPGHMMLSGSFTRPVWAPRATRCTPTSARSARVSVQFT